MKIYISGPISGLPAGNYESFLEAEDAITEKGHEAINPHKVCQHMTGSWLDYMRADIKALMDADAILLIDGWSDSRGAVVELQIAAMLGLRVFFNKLD